jgi:hypothetical protein
MSKARELAELSRTVSDSADATAITINSSEEVTFADDIFLGDSKKVVLGAGPEIEMYSNGTVGYIDTAQLIIANAAHTNNIAKFIESGAVELYHNNSKKFETTSSGIDVTGSVTADGITSSGNISSTADIVLTKTGTDDAGIKLATAGANRYLASDENGVVVIGTGTTLMGGTQYLSIDSGNATFSGSVTTGGAVTIDPADGVADDAYALTVRNNEATDGRNYGLWVRAGSNSSDESFSVRNHDNSATYFKVRGDGHTGISTTAPKTLLHVSGLTSDDDPSLGASTAPFFVTNTANNYGLNIGVNNAGTSWLQSQSNLSATAYDLSLNPLGGNVGIGESSPLGKLHIKTADSGASVDSSANELVVEGNGNAGITILSGQSYSGNIYFGDAGVNWDGYIAYSQASRKFVFGAAAGTNTLEIDSNGALIGGSATMNGKAGTSPIFEMINNDNEDNDTGRETTLRFSGHRSGGEDAINAQISGHHQGNADDDRGELKFWTNTGSGGLTEKVQIESGGDVRVKAGSLVVETSGKGIFLGGTAAANELDDYEEGTCTLTIGASVTNPTISQGNTFTAYYTKVGNKVTVTGYTGTRTITNVGSGIAKISGLPFNCQAAAYAVVNLAHNTMFTSTHTGYIEPNTDTWYPIGSHTTSGVNYPSGSKVFMFTTTYLAS